MSEHPRPLRREGRARRIAPFAGAAVLAFVVSALPVTRSPDPVLLGIAAGLTVLTFGSGFVLPWDRLPAWTHALPVYLFFPAIVLLRHVEGGAVSGFAPLVLLPVLWLAIHATRSEVIVALALAIGVFVVPIAVIGGEAYPPGEWQRAGLWAVIVSIVGVTVQRLVAELRERTAMQEVARRVTRELATEADARQGVCEAVCSAAQASTTMIFEPDGHGRLVTTAIVGGELPTLSVPIEGEPSVATMAFVAGEPLFVPDLATNPNVSRRLVEATGAASALFEPLLRGDRAVGVMVVLWDTRVASPSEATRSAIGLLAADAVAAIDRSDLLGQLAALARTDPVTGLANRRAWNEELPRELARSRRDGASVAVALLDLDDFKRVNDTEGHQAGDRLLKEAAAAWQTKVRTGDTLARYGGDEFALLLHNCGVEEARTMIDRVRAATPGGHTCSAGVARFDGSERAEKLVARADQALYEAKEAGRNRTLLGS